MLSEETNQRRRSLTFADKFEVKFFFKAEAPREVAFCETSFTTGSEGYYDNDDDYWDQDSCDDYYYDENQNDDEYYNYEGFEEANDYNDYYQYNGYGFYRNNVNFSIHYDRSNNHYHGYVDREAIRGLGCRELFGGFQDEEDNNEEKANEKTNTRRLALAKLEKGLFRRQQLRDSETYSETEESEVSTSNSESDPFDEPLPPTSGKEFLNAPVTIKATFITRDLPISIPISNHNAYKVREDKPVTCMMKAPLLNLSAISKEPVKDLLKATSPIKASSSSKNKSFDVKNYNTNNLVKNNNAKKTQETSISNLLSNIHTNTNSKGVSNKGGKKKRMRSRSSSPSSIQQLLPCY